MKQAKVTVRHMVGCAIAAAATMAFVVGPAMADEPDPEAQDRACGKAVFNALKKIGKEVKGDYQKMRSDCSELRSCKKSCRKAKRSAKRDCRKFKGKKKRQCKREARQAKRSCTAECRGAEEAASCRQARRKFWTSVAKSAHKNKGEGKKIKAACEGLYHKVTGK